MTTKITHLIIAGIFTVLILTGCAERSLLSYDEFIGLLDSGMTVSSDNLSVASKGEVSLGDINVGSPKTITFTIKSTGESPLKITDLDLKGDSGFSLNGSSSKELAKGKTMTFSVTYSPSAIENGKSAVLTIKNNSPTSKYTFTFKANGIPAGQTARPVFSIDSGSYTETQTLTLSCATASSHIRYTTDGSDPSETVGTLYTGAISLSESVIIRAIAWSDEAGSTPSTIVEKSYSFLYSPRMSVSAGTIGVASSGIYDFGTNSSNPNKSEKFTIKNTGNMNLTLGTLTLTDNTGNAFSITQPVSTSVTKGGTTTFEVKFDTSTAGTYGATISIPNNDGNNNPYKITVKGTIGTQALPPVTSLSATVGNGSVTLNWTAPTPAPEKYEILIYDDSSIFLKSTTVGSPSTTYTQTGLSASVNYTFKVYAVYSNGTSSPVSKTGKPASAWYPLNPPSDVKIENIGNNVIISWTEPNDIDYDHTNVYTYSMDGSYNYNNGNSVIPKNKGTNFAVITITTGNLYAFAVKAVNKDGHESDAVVINHDAGISITGTNGLSYNSINDDTEWEVSIGSSDGNILIPPYHDAKPVTKIADYGFEPDGASTVTSIKIPLTVKTIGKLAFYFCNNLSFNSITIPNSVTDFSYDASYYEGGQFNGCSNLTSITLSSNLKAIYGKTFKNCTQLHSITIPKSARSIYCGKQDHPTFGGSIGSGGIQGLTITMESNIPPTLKGSYWKNMFFVDNDYPSYKIKIIIPNGSLTAYLNTDWLNFLSTQYFIVDYN